MPGASVALAVIADDPASRCAGAALFPEAEQRVLTRLELHPEEPFDGPLFALLGQHDRGGCVGLVVPVLWCGPAGGAGTLGTPASDALFAVADHVNLELSGPLSGRWPPGVPRAFPSMTGIYQPAIVRDCGGARVYSSGVVAAGVADVRRLTRFEARTVRDRGWPVLSDSLVPTATVAAYYGLRLAACGVPPAPARDRE